MVSEKETLDHFFKKFSEKLAASFSPPEVRLITQFARRTLASISLEDLQLRELSDWVSSMTAFFQFVSSRKPSESKVRIYNPSLTQEGWETAHTIIEISHDNMPFLVDSVRAAINQYDLLIHRMLYTGGLAVRRDAQNRLVEIYSLSEAPEGAATEAPIYVEIDRLIDEEKIATLQSIITQTLQQNTIAVQDWSAMKAKLLSMQSAYESQATATNWKKESANFIGWLLEQNFICLGIEEVLFDATRPTAPFSPVKDSGLGLLRASAGYQLPAYFETQAENENAQDIIFAYTDLHTCVYRQDALTYIALRKYDERGAVRGECRLLGFYTETARRHNPRDIPILHSKIDQVLKQTGFAPHGHGLRSLRAILEDLPFDDLLQMSIADLLELSKSILYLQGQQGVRVFVRAGTYKHFLSCLVFIPRDRYNSLVRKQMQEVLVRTFQADWLSFDPHFSASILVRIHFIIRLKQAVDFPIDVKALEQQLDQVSRSWTDDFKAMLLQAYGEAHGHYYADRYQEAFSASYKEKFSPMEAAQDVLSIETLSETHGLNLNFYRTAEGQLHVKLFRYQHHIPLSQVIPLLEKLGLRVLEESSHTVKRLTHTVWINDFEVASTVSGEIDVAVCKTKLEEALTAVWYGVAENDGFNRLVIAAGLSWREVSILRAYAKYMRQIGFLLSQEYIEDTLVTYPQMTQALLQLFMARFHPDQTQADAVQTEIAQSILQACEQVSRLDEDRILRKYLNLIQATKRTNYFQTLAEGETLKPYISFKFCSSEIAELPKPHPLFEIFVYSPRFEGVHLRFAKVARGGLRFSDRREDFRTEVLGLVKAQQVKNAVIIPHGAKGGFVLKTAFAPDERDEMMKEGVACYQNFVRGLLDLTDNITPEGTVSPKAVVCHDEPDPYLVVAADKGTATFSDIANAISAEYHFWLGDAFASGGSAGYDHKKMGITARGTWESVKRHFRELGLDTQSEPFTVLGIGDMSGDVFGNGMLLSPHIKLIAAFDHRHIFIDPNPDTQKSFEERKRLFALSRSSWMDYNKDYISAGGGVFNRTSKYILITSEMKQRFGLTEDRLSPTQLMHALLQAKFDLLYNGGIGTFIKATTETHDEVGDRTNDAVRVNATELNCRVIAEGGNLGVTQLGRIEFELKGGRIYTDFIDNSAGVDCSDHEVNIKILLQPLLVDGQLSRKDRDVFLETMTDTVAHLVLKNNYRQTQAINLAHMHGAHRIELYRYFMRFLEKDGKLDRAIQYLPTDIELDARKAKSIGLTRPELAILLTYSKNALKSELLQSDLLHDEYCVKLLEREFPPVLCKKYHDRLSTHPLAKEIIATQMTNDIVDHMGPAFVYRLSDETGRSAFDVIKAWMIMKVLFDYDERFAAIEALDGKVPVETQFALIQKMNHLMRYGTRWFLRYDGNNISVVEWVNRFKEPVKQFMSQLTTFLTKQHREQLMQEILHWVEQGVPEPLAQSIVYSVVCWSSLDIVEATQVSHLPERDIAMAYFILGDVLKLENLREKLSNYQAETRFSALARAGYRQDLDRAQRLLTLLALENRADYPSVRASIEAWLAEKEAVIGRYQALIASLESSATFEPLMFAVALNSLHDFLEACKSKAS